jgi:hypothetical protein
MVRGGSFGEECGYSLARPNERFLEELYEKHSKLL